MKNSLIAEQNPWWKSPDKFTEFDKHLKTDPTKFVIFKRQDIELQPGNVYLILGPRQVGKTFWIKQHIKQLIDKTKDSGWAVKKQGLPDQPHHLQQVRGICYLSCDTLISRSRNELRTAIDFFVDGARDAECIYIFLDEITYIHEWKHALKELIDSGQTQRMVLVATGSSPASLKKEAETLPRPEFNQYLLKPLTFREFILQVTPRIVAFPIEKSLQAYLPELIKAVEGKTPSLDDPGAFVEMAKRILPFKKELDYLFNLYLLTGGYPFVINHYCYNHFNQGTQTISDDVYRVSMQTVLSDLKNLGYQEHLIKQVLSSIITKMGNRYSYTDLTQSAEGITRQTLVSYISHLEESFILNPLFAYDFTKKRPKYKSDKKIYFTDPFMLSSTRAWLTGKTGYDISDDFRLNNAGYLIETIVAQHLIVANEAPLMRQPDTFLWFHYNTRELDFVYKTRTDEFIGIETAYQHSPRPSDAARAPAIKKYLMLTKDEYDEFKKDPSLFMIPASLFLAVLDRGEHNL